MHRPLRICLDARIEPGLWGGVEMYIMQVGRALLSLSDGDERYSFLVNRRSASWVRDQISAAADLIMDKTPICVDPAQSTALGKLRRLARSPKRAASSMLAERRVGAAVRAQGMMVPPTVPRSCGTMEREGIDVVHFLHQAAYATGVKSIYQPHDFQHKHLPELFDQRERELREANYTFFCGQAAAIVTLSSWTKQDIVRWTGVDPGKVRVLPYPPPLDGGGTATPEGVTALRRTHDLPGDFLLCAAQTWPHKNHLGLVRAVGLLRDRGVMVNIVCSGRQNEHYEVIKAEMAKLKLQDRMKFVGFVSPTELKCLYREARGVVIPTKFEAASYPMWEAFREGRAVACSNVTSLPEQAGDAALIFDPTDATSMANAVERIWTDAALRQKLAARGAARVAGFTAERSARAYRALYRVIGGAGGSDEDRALLQAAPMM